MQVTITIPDELAARAIANGSTPEVYIEKLIEERAASAASGIIRPRPRTREELNASLDRLAQFSDKIPFLSDEQISRESIYEDHDCQAARSGWPTPTS